MKCVYWHIENVTASRVLIQAVLDGSVTLECTADSNETSILWSSEATGVDLSNSSQATVNGSTVSRLFLAQLNTSHCSSYVCTIDNNRTADITVDIGNIKLKYVYLASKTNFDCIHSLACVLCIYLILECIHNGITLIIPSYKNGTLFKNISLGDSKGRCYYKHIAS